MVKRIRTLLRKLFLSIAESRELAQWHEDYQNRHGETWDAAQERREREEKVRSRAAQEWHREGPQTVGQPCGECGSKVQFEGDAITCGQCNRPVHKRCMPKHLHGGGPTGPYR
jgi:hypothetical protein